MNAKTRDLYNGLLFSMNWDLEKHGMRFSLTFSEVCIEDDPRRPKSGKDKEGENGISVIDRPCEWRLR